jgi:hypothetical protein
VCLVFPRPGAQRAEDLGDQRLPGHGRNDLLLQY